LISYERKKRKSRALGTGIPQCLKKMGVYSVNILAGCAFECAYCKFRARRFTSRNTVIIYSQIAQQLDEELSALEAKGEKARMVLFNTGTDAFCGNERVDKLALKSLETLFGHGVHVGITTRGIISESCLELLRDQAHLTTITYSLASTSEAFRRTFEPLVPPVEEQVKMMKTLTGSGLAVRGRIDPLIPMENDATDQIEKLLGVYRSAGVREVVISYLHMLPEVANRLKSRINRVQASMLSHWFRSPEGRMQRQLESKYRKQKYETIKESATRMGMRALVCACRNADMYAGRCFLVPPRLDEQSTLL
jgi:DNA repair photolyase